MKTTTDTPPETFTYSAWRHGGWYVHNVTYPSGACGCVSRSYDDKKWRIACDPRPFEEQPTFRNRDAAARAEWELARRELRAEQAKRAAVVAQGGTGYEDASHYDLNSRLMCHPNQCERTGHDRAQLLREWERRGHGTFDGKWHDESR